MTVEDILHKKVVRVFEILNWKLRWGISRLQTMARCQKTSS